MGFEKIGNSLALSKKLNEVGFKCDKEFCWTNPDNAREKPKVIPEWALLHGGEKRFYYKSKSDFFIPAYTTKELLAWFDKKLCVFVQHGGGIKAFTAGFDVCGEEGILTGDDVVFFEADTPEDALANLVLWFLENNNE